MKFDQKIIRYGALASSLLAIIALFAFLPSEWTPVSQASFESHMAEYYSDECIETKRELYEARIAADRYISEGLPVPKWLIDEISRLEEKLDRVCNSS